MTLPRPLLICTGFVLAAFNLHAIDVLFVGNSFTFGHSDYNHAAITDANGQGHGGVPALFKKMADEGGFADVNVTIEAARGQNLDHYLKGKASLIGQRWDYVILQDHSLRTLANHPGGNVAAFRRSVQALAELAREHNPSARVLLYQTWAFPTLVPEVYASMRIMQDEIAAACSAAVADFSLAGSVPVGEAFMQALETGLAYDPAQGPEPGKFNLYVRDNLHPSKYGCYLAAALFYAEILGGDPRQLPTGAGSGAARLGIKPAEAAGLQHIAHSLGVGASFAPPVPPRPAREQPAPPPASASPSPGK
jgi:hypothetical protein